MAKKVPRKFFESSKAPNFVKVADNFYEGAKLAYEFEYYNAAGVLLIHAAIALADAITIKKLKVKCSGDNHYEVIKLLEEATIYEPNSKRSIFHLVKLIDHKNMISYSGDIYSKKDVDKLIKHFIRFSDWTHTIIE